MALREIARRAHAGADPLALLTERDWTARYALGVITDQIEELAERDREDLARRIRNHVVDAMNGGEG